MEGVLMVLPLVGMHFPDIELIHIIVHASEKRFKIAYFRTVSSASGSFAQALHQGLDPTGGIDYLIPPLLPSHFK